MNRPRDPETTIASWLDEGPDRLPPITRQVVVSSIHVTPQRGRAFAWRSLIPSAVLPRRYSQMSNLMRLAVTAVLTIAVGGFLYGGFRLASTSAPAAPSSESPAAVTAPTEPFVSVRGTGSCDDEVGGITTSSNGLMMTNGATMECTSDMNDPRVSGTWTIAWNRAWTGSGPAIWWGTGKLDDPDGAWDCSWILTDNPRAESYPILNVCRGSGAYDGLAYVFQHVMGGGAEDLVLGYISEGPPPVDLAFAVP